MGIHTDETGSDTKLTRRDELHRMLRDCRLEKIGLILAKSVARLTKNTVSSIRAIHQLKELGVGIYFEKEGINALPEKSEQLPMILSSVAQGESESVSINNRWVIVRRFRNGIYTINSSTYGYVNDGSEGLVTGQGETAVVRRIFDSYLGGKGSYAITRGLRQEELPTVRYSKDWQDSIVKGILQNPVYEGDLFQ